MVVRTGRIGESHAAFGRAVLCPCLRPLSPNLITYLAYWLYQLRLLVLSMSYTRFTIFLEKSLDLVILLLPS